MALVGLAQATASRPREVAPREGQSAPPSRAAAEAELRERQAKERRQSPPARQERERSRTAYRESDQEDSRRLANERFDRQLNRPPSDLEAPPGGRILRYTDDWTALVDQGSDELGRQRPKALAVSELPLRRGPKGKVDVSLQQSGAAWQPRNALAQATLPVALTQGIELGGSGARLFPLASDGTPASAGGERDGNKVVWHEALPDTDVLALPLSAGVELFWQLRSPEAPETLSLRVDLPPGARLVQPEEDGPVMVRQGSEDRAGILPPAALDAQGSNVPARMRVAAPNRVELSLAHRSQDLAYPILLDPPVIDSWYFGAGHHPFTEHWNRFQTDGSYRMEYHDFLGWGLYISAMPGSYADGAKAVWYWRDPYWHDRTNYIDHVDFHNEHSTFAQDFWTINYIYAFGEDRAAAAEVMGGGIHGETVSLRWPDGISPPPNGPEAGDGIWFEIQARDPVTIGDRRIAYVGNIVNYLTDPEAPTIHSVEHLSQPTGWVDGGSYSARIRAIDPGLGVNAVWVDSAGVPRVEADDDCSGSPEYDPCETDKTMDVNYDVSGWPEGVHAVHAGSEDIVNHVGAPSASWDVKLDRSAPEVELSGPLKLLEGQEVPPGSYQLNVDARDGDPSGPDSAKRSGVRSIEILLDGQTVDYAEQDCANHSCPMSRTWTFDTNDHPGGEHTIEVVSRDQLGHEKREPFTVKTACCYEASNNWGTSSALSDTSYGDVNGDDIDDLVGRDRLTQEIRVGLSTGSRFESPAPWGHWSALDPLAHLSVADVTGDRLEDLVGRNPVTGAVLVAESTGSGFNEPTQWGSWPVTRDFHVGDVDGDGAADIVGRDLNGETLWLAYSNQSTSFVEEHGAGTFPADHDIYLGDVDADDADDVVGRHPHSGALRVALSTDDAFAASSAWGSLAGQRQVLLADVNGDARVDVAGRDQLNGELEVATSNGEAFATPQRQGSFPVGYGMQMPDANGDGQADLAGVQLLTGDVAVALANAVIPLKPLGEQWTPNPGDVYEDEDILEAANDEPAEPPDVPIPNPVPDSVSVADSGAASSPAMKLAFQDPRRPLHRLRLANADGTEIVGNAWTDARPAGDSSLARIYSRIRQAGARIVRFSVHQPNYQSEQGGFYETELQRLEEEVRLAEVENGVDVYVTLTGPADIAAGCSEPCYSIADFAAFAREVVRRLKGRVHTYSVWNEPNTRKYLRGSSTEQEDDVFPWRTYRKVYTEAYKAIRSEHPTAKVLLGEISAYPTGSKLRMNCDNDDEDEPPRRRTAIEFLRAVSKAFSSSCGMGGDADPIRTHGVAWHPYQHRKHPTSIENPKRYGISRLGAINATIRDIADRRDPDTNPPNAKRLVSPKGRIPRLYLTEFGYLNQPSDRLRDKQSTKVEKKKAGNNYWHTERLRADLFPKALDEARRHRARWMVIYHATEIPPLEFQTDQQGRRDFDLDYGLFAKNGAVTGDRCHFDTDGHERCYGKDPTGPPIDYRGYEHRQRRQAYCAIRKWAIDHRYAPEFAPDCGSAP